MVKQKHNMDVNPQRLMITQHAHTQNHQTFTLGAFKVNMTLFTVHLSPVSSEQHITRSNGFVLTLKKGLKHADRQAFVREVNVWLRFNLCSIRISFSLFVRLILLYPVIRDLHRIHRVFTQTSIVSEAKIISSVYIHIYVYIEINIWALLL